MNKFLTVFGFCLFQTLFAHWSHFPHPKKFANNTALVIKKPNKAQVFFSRMKEDTAAENKYHIYEWELVAGERLEARVYLAGHAYPKMTMEDPVVVITAQSNTGVDGALEDVSFDTDSSDKKHQFDPWLCITLKERFAYTTVDPTAANVTVKVTLKISTDDNKALRYGIAVGPESPTTLGMVIRNMITMQRAKLWNRTFHVGGLAIAVSILYVVFNIVYAFVTDGKFWTANILSFLLDMSMLCFAIMVVDAWISGVAARTVVETTGASLVTLHMLPNSIYFFSTLCSRIIFNKGYYAVAALKSLVVLIACLMWGSGGLLIAPICLGLAVIFFFCVYR